MDTDNVALHEVGNPLLEALGCYVPYNTWPKLLEFDPLTDLDFSSLSEEWQDIYIERTFQRFAPTSIGIEVAAALQTIRRASYAIRNPTLPEQKQRIAAIAATRGKPGKAVAIGPPLVYGKLIYGITGLGKSAILVRALSHEPQVVVHERSNAAGWIRHVQITYLIVQMASSRGGILYAILEEIDRVAGTDYRLKYSSGAWTVDKLLVEVAAILALHSVGILIIEEIQVRNFALSPHREELLLFFLRLLNHGIPVILVGNPLGFEQIDDFSQDVRRLTRSDPVELMPAPSVDDEDWDQDIAPAIWNYGLVEGSVPYATIRQDLWRHAGGIPDFAATIASGCQRSSFRHGPRTLEHFQQFIAKSPRLRKNCDLIDGFASRDPWKLSRYLDVPWEEYAIRWGFSVEDVLGVAEDAGTEATNDLPPEELTGLVNVHTRLRARYQRSLARRRSRGETSSPVCGRDAAGGQRAASDVSLNLAEALGQLKQRLDAQSAGKRRQDGRGRGTAPAA